MLGLLGGLIGGGLRRAIGGGRGGGVLGGLMGGGRGRQQQRSRSTPPSRNAPVTPEPQTADRQSAQPDQQPQAPVQPNQQPMVSSVADQVREPMEQQQQAQGRPQQSPIEGLLDDAPAARDAPEPSGPDEKPEPQSVVNMDKETLTPTARPQEETLGQVPQIEPPDIASQLFDEIPRSDFQFQEGNPSRQPDMSDQSYTSDQGYRYVGPQSTAEGVPQLSYRGRRR